MKPYEPNDPTTWKENKGADAERRRTEIRETETAPVTLPQVGRAGRTEQVREAQVDATKPEQDDIYRTNVIRNDTQSARQHVEGEIRVPLVEEELSVAKSWVEAGAVVIKKEVETRTERLPVELAHEEVQVERVAVNRILGKGETAQPRQEGETLIIPVVEEEIVVLKQQVVREEIRVTKRRAVRQEEVSDVVRIERLNIETAGQVEPEGNSRP